MNEVRMGSGYVAKKIGRVATEICWSGRGGKSLGCGNSSIEKAIVRKQPLQGSLQRGAR
jgi:hypothetical protein